jgi:hypothetical protein
MARDRAAQFSLSYIMLFLQRRSLAHGKHVARPFCFRIAQEGELGSQQSTNSLLSHIQQGRGPQAQGDYTQGSQGDGYTQGPG